MRYLPISACHESNVAGRLNAREGHGDPRRWRLRRVPNRRDPACALGQQRMAREQRCRVAVLAHAQEHQIQPALCTLRRRNAAQQRFVRVRARVQWQRGVDGVHVGDGDGNSVEQCRAHHAVIGVSVMQRNVALVHKDHYPPLPLYGSVLSQRSERLGQRAAREGKQEPPAKPYALRGHRGHMGTHTRRQVRRRRGYVE